MPPTARCCAADVRSCTRVLAIHLRTTSLTLSRCSRRSAHAEASAHFEAALDLLGDLPANEQRDALELDLTLDLAVPLIAVHGFGALRVEQCALKAMALLDALPKTPSGFAARRLAWN